MSFKREAIKRAMRTAGAMPRIKVYDNGGKSFDRYTVVVIDRAWAGSAGPGMVPMLGLSENPTHPQGFSQFTDGQDGSHLGKLIKFTDLPRNVQEHVKGRLTEDGGRAAFRKAAIPEDFEIFVESADMMTEEDSYENGAFGPHQQVWEMGHASHSFKSWDQLVKFFAHTPGAPEDKDSWSVMDDGRLAAQWMVDEDNNNATPRDLAEFKKGKKRLWIADLNVYVYVAKKYTPSEEELVKATGFQRM